MKPIFETIFVEYRDPVYNYISSMTNASPDTDDIMQEAFLKIYRSLDKYKEKGNLRAWIYRIVNNTIIDFKRKAKTGHTLSMEQTAEPACQNLPQDNLQHKETQRVLTESIDALPQKLKQIYLLRAENDITFREIADILDQPLNRILGRMHLAVKRLRENYIKYSGETL